MQIMRKKFAFCTITLHWAQYLASIIVMAEKQGTANAGKIFLQKLSFLTTLILRAGMQVEKGQQISANFPPCTASQLTPEQLLPFLMRVKAAIGWTIGVRYFV
jgi:hypothetical protein